MKLVKGILKSAYSAANRTLGAMETAGSGPADIPFRPIFIIGAPRSGSTLLYQAMTEALDVGYISNLHGLAYGAPSFVERLIKPLRWRRPTTYQSKHGTTERWTDPSECGAFWYRFFRRSPQYVPIEEADAGSLRKMRRAVARLTRAFRRPVLFKNMHCGLRLVPIASAMPEALFIVTHRNLLDNARSLLQSRKKIRGSYEEWWSMEPPDVDQLRTLEPHQQVVEQVRSILKLIDHDRAVIGADRFFDVEYESFCADPTGAVTAVDQWLGQRGVELRWRGSLPPAFEQPRTSTLEPALMERLASYVAE